MDIPQKKKYPSIIEILENGSQYEAYLLIMQNLVPDLNITNLKGTTPLILSIMKAHHNLIKLLISKGANVNKANHRKMTPLMYAVYLGDFDICALLIENGANINAQDDNKNTALIFAVMTNQLSLVRFFIKKGANIYLANLDGRMAFDIAPKKGTCSIAYLLLNEMQINERNNLRLINFNHNNLIKNFTLSLTTNSQKVYDDLMPTRYIHPSSTFYLLPTELIRYIAKLLTLIKDYDEWYKPFLADLKPLLDDMSIYKKRPAVIFSSRPLLNYIAKKSNQTDLNNHFSQLSISTPKNNSKPELPCKGKNKKNS